VFVSSLDDSFVSSYVRYARCDYSKTSSSFFVKFGRDVQHLSEMSL